MRFVDMTAEVKHDLIVNIAHDLHSGVAIRKITKRYGLSDEQVRCIRLKLARGDININWSDFNFDFSVKYGDIDKQAAEYQKRVVKSDIDWSKVSIGPCLGVWRYDDD